MKETNNIDDLFLNGIKTAYPYDKSLWAAVESQLPVQTSPATPWFYSLNSIALIIVLLTCSFIPKDNTRAAKSTYFSRELIGSRTINSEMAYANKSLKTNDGNSIETSIEEGANSSINIQNQPIRTKNQINESEQVITNPTRTVAKKNMTTSTERKEVAKAQSKNIAKYKTVLNKQKQAWNSNKTNAPLIARSDVFKKPLKAFQGTLYKFPLKPFHNLSATSFAIEPKKEDKLKRLPREKSLYNSEVEALLSISTSKELSDGPNIDLDAKNAGETSVQLQSIGVNIVGQKKVFVYGTGIQQTQYTERFSYNVDVEKNRLISSYDTSYSVVSGNFNSNGVPVLLIKQEVTENQSNETYTGIENTTGLNTFKWIGVPVFVGVQKSFKNWQVQARLSVITQFSYDQSGYYLNDDLNRLSPLSKDDFSKVHFTNRNDLSLGYSFHEQFAIGAKYGVQRDLNSFKRLYGSQLRGQLIGVWVLWKP